MTNLKTDLDELMNNAGSLWEGFRGAKIFITGGTGFFGKWLLESFFYANAKYNLELSIVVLSRNPEHFVKNFPHLMEGKIIKFYQGDVRNFNAPEGKFTHIIHAATESSGAQAQQSALHMVDTIIAGTRRVLDFAREANIKKMIYVSSGAVYGRSRQKRIPIVETDNGAPAISGSGIEYDESKRMAEALCAIYHKEFNVPVVIARCFSFVGPHLPLDEHFAIGNFIRDAINNEPISVNSAGTAIRSYLYASDLVGWLLTILVNGKSGSAYNVGSDKEVTIKELAHIVRKLINPNLSVTFAESKTTTKTTNYQVPDITLAKQELGLSVNVDLNEAIIRTANWYKENPPLKHPIESRPFAIAAKPDAVIFDFDGVMTDNSVVVFQDEKEAVICDRADGLGISMLRKKNIPMLVLSTETNPVVTARCKKLKLECFQGIEDKGAALTDWLKKNNYKSENTIYLGNDINDLECLKLVGYPMVVADAYEEAKNVAKLILSRKGGKGAVRELADMILESVGRS